MANPFAWSLRKLSERKQAKREALELLNDKKIRDRLSGIHSSYWGERTGLASRIGRDFLAGLGLGAVGAGIGIAFSFDAPEMGESGLHDPRVSAPAVGALSGFIGGAILADIHQARKNRETKRDMISEVSEMLREKRELKTLE